MKLQLVFVVFDAIGDIDWANEFDGDWLGVFVDFQHVTYKALEPLFWHNNKFVRCGHPQASNRYDKAIVQSHRAFSIATNDTNDRVL